MDAIEIGKKTKKKAPPKGRKPSADDFLEALLAPKAEPTYEDVNLDRITRLGERLSELVYRIKGQAFLPTGVKTPPVYGLLQLAALCHMAPESLLRRLAKADETGLPQGTLVQSKSQATETDADDEADSSDTDKKGATKSKGTGRRQWTLSEARQWIRACGVPFIRPAGVQAAVITVANFKGGVGKTVTTMSLAQGLSLLGYKVLAIDFDPQGSLTSLFGVLPTEVDQEMTALPVMLPPGEEGARSTIKESIRETYWDGLDLIAGSRNLFSGEFYLPQRQLHKEENGEPDFNFYNALRDSMKDGTLDEYDFIVIDTMPALSYLTMNTLWAADAILMPLPPEGLDIVSSSQFWNMFTEMTAVINDKQDAEKKFSFVKILPSKVDHTKGHTKALLQLIDAGYEELVLPIEIPVTQVVSHSGTELRTVFDITKYVGAAKTYERARTAYGKLVSEIDKLTRNTCWRDKSKE